MCGIAGYFGFDVLNNSNIGKMFNSNETERTRFS